MLTHKRFQVEPLDISFLKFHSQTDLNNPQVNTARSGKELSISETNYSQLSASKIATDSEEDLDLEPMEEEFCEEFCSEWSCQKGAECPFTHASPMLRKNQSKKSTMLENFPELMLVNAQRRKSFLEWSA